MASASSIVKLADARTECDGVSVFDFTRPPGYRFAPGQYQMLTLQTREGSQTKPFTHCDAPDDEHARVLTRLTGSAFKDALVALKPGDEVSMTGPHGRLIVPDGVRKAGFLVGGVGITPASSIVRDAARRQTGLQCLVIYGNKDESCIPLREEFASYEKEPGISVVDVLAEPAPSWAGERGFITADLVRRHCDPLDEWHWFLSGPPTMVGAMRAVLTELGVPEAATSFEEFTGYQ